jgi:Rod binding domain-containing protein
MLSAEHFDPTFYAAKRAEDMAARVQRLAQANDPRSQEIKKAAEEFEGMFLGQMLEHLFAGIQTNELFGGGQAEDIYRSMMVQEYGKIMAKSGGIGVADHVARQMLQHQESGV